MAGSSSENLIIISFQSFLLLSFGGIFGAWSRFWLLDYLARFCRRKYLSTFFVNFISTIILSFIFLSQDKLFDFNPSFLMFFVTGFLGSLSTFSTFIMEVFESFINNSWIEGIQIIAWSVLGTFSIGFIIFLLIKFA